MIVDEDKNGRNIDIDIKHGVFCRSWLTAAVSVISTKPQYL
jgi:hypothetical protein